MEQDTPIIGAEGNLERAISMDNDTDREDKLLKVIEGCERVIMAGGNDLFRLVEKELEEVKEFREGCAHAPSDYESKERYVLNKTELDARMRVKARSVDIPLALASRAYSIRAISYLLLREDDAAMHDADKAILIDPGNAPAYNTMGFMLYEMQYNKEAKTHFERAAYHAPEFSGTHSERVPLINLAKTYTELGEHKKAVTELIRAARLPVGATDPKLYSLLAAAYWKLETDDPEKKKTRSALAEEHAATAKMMESLEPYKDDFRYLRVE